MFISNLYIEKLISNKDEGEFIENPNWNQIESAIKELNGKNITLITLGCNDEKAYMMIGGGDLGKYILVATLDNFTFYNLVDLSKNDAVEKLVVGGQGVNYSARLCVDLQKCLIAAKTFAESGQLETLLTWENENDDSLVTV